MKTAGLGPVGVALNVSADNAHLAEAAELEALGYSAVWLPGGDIDSLGRVGDLLAATTSVRVGTAVIPPDVYDADAVVTAYARFERDHPGRFLAGFGSPQRARQLALLGGYLDRLDAAEEPVPRRRRLLAALGPRKLALARDRGAGAVPLLVTPGYTAWARRILGEEATLVVYQLAVGDTDAARARRTARKPTLRGLTGVGGYPENMRRMGFTAEQIATLDDALVDALIGWGDDAAIAARVGEHLEAGADHVVLGVLHDGDQPGPAELARGLAASGVLGEQSPSGRQ
ncbi:LLM class F420-dependent oxidoreductase [Prauserella marina]|uniref:Probable F420-dependent oxidoreductase, MSMEG_4141 family n=1 Tax=Prauserella marina TaxID=530584 RepID=A0A222VKH8_9PSEU|nr:TIGR03620 family F420-dependent LLM class oxidoreductase [Prauserella marina]ASR34430.1 LLM class F420-dependent oxidoreductase [Prauserella marina]PWV70986.1 putative F420-dependent oxidoreductase [Prauserella marina]SDE00165.1 probable F420-dependent oxidoreductase, MSMEG_4141 family [Prauserella marina]